MGRWRNRRRYRAAHRGTHRDACTASERARAFVLGEFFKLDRTTLARVIDLYGSKYTEGARKYFEATFEKWRSGEVQPKPETQDRILHCVPKYLPPAKQFMILGFYIPEYMKQLLAASRLHQLTVESIPVAFADAANRCRKTAPKLDWFVRGVFSEHELAVFADVARYTVLDRLHRSYAAARLDLLEVSDQLADVDGMITIRYRLDVFEGVIKFNGMVPPLAETAFLLPTVPEMVVQHREEYERLLLDHHFDMLVEDQAQIARQAVARLDLSVLQNAIGAAFTKESMESTFRFRSAGGSFDGSICRKNLPGLKQELYGRIAIAILCTIAVAIGIGAAFTWKDLRGLAFWGIWLVLPVGAALWSWVGEKFKEVRDYERGQSTRFAKDRR